MGYLKESILEHMFVYCLFYLASLGFCSIACHLFGVGDTEQIAVLIIGLVLATIQIFVDAMTKFDKSYMFTPRIVAAFVDVSLAIVLFAIVVKFRHFGIYSIGSKLICIAVTGIYVFLLLVPQAVVLIVRLHKENRR